MHRVDDASASNTLPVAIPAGPKPNAYFKNDTIVQRDFMNAVQEETCGVIEKSGLVLDKTKNDQLFNAIKRMQKDPHYFSHYYNEIFSTTDIAIISGSIVGASASRTDADGIVGLDGGTTGNAGSFSFPPFFNNRSGEITAEFHIYLTQLADATDDYEATFGMFKSPINPPFTNVDLMSFRYNYLTSGHWRVVTNDDAGGSLNIDTGVAATANTRTKLKIIYDTVTPSAKFYIDDVLVHTESAAINLFTANSDNLFCAVAINNISSATSRPVEIDSFEYTHFFPNGR